MSKVHKRGAAKAEMNMTPMIDVTFQLIIFFMLVNNIIAEQNVELIPPDLEQAQTLELGEKVAQVVVSIEPLSYTAEDRKENPLNFSGEAVSVWIGSMRLPREDLATLTKELEDSVAKSPKNEKGEPLLEVLLRADCALHYAEIQPVMQAITAAKVAKINLVAYLPEDKR